MSNDKRCKSESFMRIFYRFRSRNYKNWKKKQFSLNSGLTVLWGLQGICTSICIALKFAEQILLLPCLLSKITIISSHRINVFVSNLKFKSCPFGTRTISLNLSATIMFKYIFKLTADDLINLKVGNARQKKTKKKLTIEHNS